MVDDDVRPQLARALQLVVAAGRYQHACPGMLGDLQRRRCNAAADAENQHRLARHHAGLADHHPPGGEKNQREGGRLLEAHPLRDRPQVDLRHRKGLGKAAIPVFAEDFPAVAEAVLAAGAVIAGAVAQAGVEEHARANRVAARAGTIGGDHAGAVGAADMGQGDFGDGAVTGEQIEMVERCRPKRDQHLPGPGLGARDLLVTKHLWSAVLMKSHRFHEPTQLTGAAAFAESNAVALTRRWPESGLNGCAERKSRSVTLQYRNPHSQTRWCQKS